MKEWKFVTKNVLETIESTLKSLNPTSKKIVIAHESELLSKVKRKTIVVALSDNFEVNYVLSIIDDVKYVGIINPDKFNIFSMTELINILTNKNKATVVNLTLSPVSCKVIYPILEVGDTHVCGNYEYRYGQGYGYNS